MAGCANQPRKKRRRPDQRNPQPPGQQWRPRVWITPATYLGRPLHVGSQRRQQSDAALVPIIRCNANRCGAILQAAGTDSAVVRCANQPRKNRRRPHRHANETRSRMGSNDNLNEGTPATHRSRQGHVGSQRRQQCEAVRVALLRCKENRRGAILQAAGTGSAVAGCANQPRKIRGAQNDETHSRLGSNRDPECGHAGDPP